MAQKILLVEDNRDNQTIYQRALEHFGYTVISAWDGHEAVSLAVSELPDLILMDISIPGINGWDAARTIMDDERTSHIPILALTAHALKADRDRGNEMGFVRYLTKPIEPRRVVQEIEEVLARKEPG